MEPPFQEHDRIGSEMVLPSTSFEERVKTPKTSRPVGGTAVHELETDVGTAFHSFGRRSEEGVLTIGGQIALRPVFVRGIRRERDQPTITIRDHG